MSNQRIHAISSGHHCYNRPETVLTSKSHITIACGVIALLGGLFLALAAYHIFPNGVNAISRLGGWGYALSYSAICAGILLVVCGSWKCVLQKKKDGQISISATEDRDLTRVETEWQKQIKKAELKDIKAGSNSWKREHKDEVEQTFAAFETSESMLANAHRDVLKIVIIDSGISEEERQILHIVSAYLEAVHGVTVLLTADYILTSKKKREEQYAYEPNIALLMKDLPENTFVLGFTSKDLYPYRKSKDVNFIFGVGISRFAAGLFSTCRLRSSKFETNLIRLMNLASHEFGHMRGIAHCTKYACCMQGANNVKEADKTPLTFCAQDMAKICYLNGWSLKEGYQRQMNFFENFERHYGKKVNFSKEIQRLTQKIKAL
jgi:archaemetzincin